MSVLRLRVARGFFDRLLGLHAIPFGADDQGLMLVPCRAIHTFGLKVPIDVVFVDRTYAAILCVRSLPPNRVAGAWHAHGVVELPGGYCARHPDWAHRLARACAGDAACSGI